MQNFENADKMNAFIKTSIEKAKVKIENKYDLLLRVIRKEISSIWKDNLQIKGLVGGGEDCEYKTIADLLVYFHGNLDELSKEIAQMNNKCSYNS